MSNKYILKQGHFTVKKFESSNITELLSEKFLWCTAFSAYNFDTKIGCLAHFDLPSTAYSIQDIVNKLLKEVRSEVGEQDGGASLVFKVFIACGLESTHSPATRSLIMSEIKLQNDKQSDLIFDIEEVAFEENKSLFQDVRLNLENGKFKVYSHQKHIVCELTAT